MSATLRSEPATEVWGQLDSHPKTRSEPVSDVFNDGQQESLKSLRPDPSEPVPTQSHSQTQRSTPTSEPWSQTQRSTPTSEQWKPVTSEDPSARSTPHDESWNPKGPSTLSRRSRADTILVEGSSSRQNTESSGSVQQEASRSQEIVESPSISKKSKPVSEIPSDYAVHDVYDPSSGEGGHASIARSESSLRSQTMCSVSTVDDHEVSVFDIYAHSSGPSERHDPSRQYNRSPTARNDEQRQEFERYQGRTPSLGPDDRRYPRGHYDDDPRPHCNRPPSLGPDDRSCQRRDLYNTSPGPAHRHRNSMSDVYDRCQPKDDLSLSCGPADHRNHPNGRYDRSASGFRDDQRATDWNFSSRGPDNHYQAHTDREPSFGPEDRRNPNGYYNVYPPLAPNEKYRATLYNDHAPPLGPDDRHQSIGQYNRSPSLGPHEPSRPTLLVSKERAPPLGPDGQYQPKGHYRSKSPHQDIREFREDTFDFSECRDSKYSARGGTAEVFHAGQRVLYVHGDGTTTETAVIQVGEPGNNNGKLRLSRRPADWVDMRKVKKLPKDVGNRRSSKVLCRGDKVDFYCPVKNRWVHAKVTRIHDAEYFEIDRDEGRFSLQYHPHRVRLPGGHPYW
eukprot:gnl/MRDRNA2_/MRDRNA2_25241_c0_seq1.p1 gnl/MRDRNA2_/MRDRNA2_25241_c0~~gnl/MRDRNA2_/MRDRNA2_25241_c0_seq1.p1  ORF type:complete len:715 (+),score=53.21 gnl/MRDRNA2_/MRDRNA2_25241_c0_seq1:293-2146(+)